jgi:RNA recognition motif-containing protein
MEPDDCNETLYIQNLNEKIKPQGDEYTEMRALLHQLFSQYGTVIEVVNQSQYRMRGQAFVIYDSKVDSSNAMRILQSYYFYGKAMVKYNQKISYSQSKSDIIAQRDGIYIQRPASYVKQKRNEFFNRLKLKNSIKKRTDIGNSNGNHGFNNILFLERLENSVNENFLVSVFGLYHGFKEVRLISEKGVAFIEFNESEDASKALVGLNGYKVSPTCQFFITYAKRG